MNETIFVVKVMTNKQQTFIFNNLEFALKRYEKYKEMGYNPTLEEKTLAFNYDEK